MTGLMAVQPGTRERTKTRGMPPGMGAQPGPKVHRVRLVPAPRVLGGTGGHWGTRQPGDVQQTHFQRRDAITLALRPCVAQQVTGGENIPKPELCKVGAHGRV